MSVSREPMFLTDLAKKYDPAPPKKQQHRRRRRVRPIDYERPGPDGMDTAQREAAARRLLDQIGIDVDGMQLEDALLLHTLLQTKEARSAVRMMAVCSTSGLTFDAAKQKVTILATSVLCHKPEKLVRDTVAAFLLAFHHKLLGSSSA